MSRFRAAAVGVIVAIYALVIAYAVAFCNFWRERLQP